MKSMMLMQDPPIVEPSVPDIRTTTIFLNESPVYLNPPTPFEDR